MSFAARRLPGSSLLIGRATTIADDLVRLRALGTRAVLLACAAALLASCAVGPNYRRPAIDVPATTRGQVTPAEAASLADLPWWRVFEDPVLQDLVAEALRNNRDLQAAIHRVEQSRQQIGVSRADMFPQIEYQGGAERQRAFVFPGIPNETFNSFIGAFNLTWEIDVWGRIRRATESARAEYLGAQAFRRGVVLTVVSQVAQAYFELLELDRELEIGRVTSATFERTLDLFSRQYHGGVGTLLQVSRAQASLAQAAETIPRLETSIVAKENQLTVLLGHLPGPVPRGVPLAAQTTPPDVPTGLPAQLLERRPDIVEAEEAVVAANANVGVAVGNFFPRLGLTSLYGGQSSEIENLVKNAGNVWAIAGSLTGPIFQGGRLLASYRSRKAGWEQTVEQYIATTLDAFAEVSKTIVAHDKLKVVRIESERRVNALQQAVDVSLQGYTAGVSTYFEVLEAQQQLFTAQLDLASTTSDQLTVVVRLYRALGGGWSLDVDQWAPPATMADAPSPGERTGAAADPRNDCTDPLRCPEAQP